MLKNLVIAVVVIALVAGAFSIINGQKKDSFFLIREEGDIFFKNTETESYLTLSQDEISLQNGSYIKTGEFSSAHVILPDNTVISLDEKTELQINLADEGIEIFQFLGKTWNRVETLTNGKKFEIKSGDAVAAVRGTIFHFEVNADGTKGIKVVEHSVALSNTAQEILTNEEESGVVSVEGKITKGTIPESFLKSRWYIRNKVLDQIKRTGLDNIFLKDKIKKEFIRDELVQTRFNIKDTSVQSSLLSIVIDTSDSTVCSKTAEIPPYVKYSKFGELYEAFLGSCADNRLEEVEIKELARIYATIK